MDLERPKKRKSRLVKKLILLHKRAERRKYRQMLKIHGDERKI